MEIRGSETLPRPTDPPPSQARHPYRHAMAPHGRPRGGAAETMRHRVPTSERGCQGVEEDHSSRISVATKSKPSRLRWTISNSTRPPIASVRYPGPRMSLKCTQSSWPGDNSGGAIAPHPSSIFQTFAPCNDDTLARPGLARVDHYARRPAARRSQRSHTWSRPMRTPCLMSSTPSTSKGCPRRTLTEREAVSAASPPAMRTSSSRQPGRARRSWGVPSPRCSIRKLANYLADNPVRTVLVGRERLRQYLREHKISFQAHPDVEGVLHQPHREAKLNRVEEVSTRFPQRCFTFDQFGPLSIRPQPGSGWAPVGKSERQPATYTHTHSVRSAWMMTCCGVSTANARAAPTLCPCSRASAVLVRTAHRSTPSWTTCRPTRSKRSSGRCEPS